ncbi:MAG: substrate-binding domain-containing protein [Candidatus Bathyarchaeia archaeon]
MKEIYRTVLSVVLTAIIVGTAVWFLKPTPPEVAEVPALQARIAELENLVSQLNATLAAIPRPFKDIKIVFFCGGDPGDVFASIVYQGAKLAEAILGCKVEYVFSGWLAEKMVEQFRDAVAREPDAICMMGHPGEAALKDLIDEARRKGIVVTLINVDLPRIRAKYAAEGMGYVGQDLNASGRLLATAALKKFNLKPGDHALVICPLGSPGRMWREYSVGLTFQEAGLKVGWIDSTGKGWAADPARAIPEITGYLAANPDVKIIVYPGGQMLAAAPMYMEAAGKKAGEIINIGFDLNPGVLEAFKKGYVQLTLDQQPLLQGFLPILQACLTVKYKIAGLYIDTGGALIDETNYFYLEELVKAGYR